MSDPPAGLRFERPPALDCRVCSGTGLIVATRGALSPETRAVVQEHGAHVDSSLIPPGRAYFLACPCTFEIPRTL